MYITPVSQYFVLLLRIAMGWVLIYDGFLKFTSKTWNIISLIRGSHIAPEIYNQLALEPFTSLLTQFYPIALIIAGALILTGLWIRIGGGIAITLLLFAYLPSIQPSLSAHIINSTIIYILVISVLLSVRADQFWGLGADVRINK
jgi:uncharacterized membrane protein YphA (DoxX/SURF4 family)